MLFTLNRIVGLQRHVKQVLAIHALVHHELSRDGRALTGLQGRRTDDGLRRSATLDHAHRRGRIQHQWLIAGVLHFEFGAHGLVKGLTSQVNAFRIQREARA